MKWQEVGYTLHEWRCTVLFDTPNLPLIVQRFDGTIECATAGAIPLLKNVETEQIISPPPWAIVIIIPKEFQIGFWDIPKPQRKR